MIRRSQTARSSLQGLCALAAGAAIGSGLAACELVGNIQQRTLGTTLNNGGDGGLTDGGVGDGAVGASFGLNHCVVPSTGTGLVRFGNLVPTTTRVDVCLRPSNSPSFATIQPVFASAGANCAPGLGYKDVTVSLGIAPDTYEVRVVPAGQPCTATPTATLTTALVEAAIPIAIQLFGNGEQAPSLRRYVESRPSQSAAAAMRLYNMAEALGPLDFGLASGATLPTTIQAGRILDLGFGEATPNDSTQTDVDANGYVNQQSGSGRFDYAVAPTGTKTATVATARTIAAGSAYSFFAVGRTDTPDFPIELFACDETTAGSSVLANCADAPPVVFTMDTVNLQLSGAFSGAEAARRPYGIAAVASLDSDFVCVTEIYQPADTAALAAAAQGQFPYSYAPLMPETMAPNYPANLAGQTPALPTSPPCASSMAALDALVACAQANCSTDPGDASAVAVQNPSDCLSNSCAGQILALAGGTTDDALCLACTFWNYAAYETMTETLTRCSTDNLGGIAFGGQGGTMLLSRRPLQNTSAFRMPQSNGWITSGTKATVTLDNGTPVDVFCIDGASVLADCTFEPVVSPWGDNADGGPASDCIQSSLNFQTLMNTDVVAWVESSSGLAGSKIIVSGDFYSGPSYQDQVQALYPQNFAILNSAFSIGTATNYAPECTDCVDNTMRTAPGGTPSGLNTWTRFNLLQNIPITDVQSNEVFLKEDVVDGGPGNGATSVPISTYYAFRSVLLISP